MSHRRPEVPGCVLHRDTYDIYNEVICNVIKKIKDHFYNENLDDEVIDCLRSLWIEKLNNSKVLATPEQYIPQKVIKKAELAPGQKPDVLSQTLPQSTNIITQMSQQAQARPRVVVGQPMDSQIKVQAQAQVHNQNAGLGGPVASKQPRLNPNQNIYGHHLDGHLDESDDDSEDELESSSSSSDDLDNNDAQEELSDNETSESSGAQLEQEKDLCSDDDLSNDGDAMFNCSNVVLCQYQTVKRNKEKWTIKFSNGVMNVRQRDYIFSSLTGDANW